jgi:TolB-like protein
LRTGVRSALRITGQLIDAISGAHLWADHFDGRPNSKQLGDAIPPTLPV